MDQQNEYKRIYIQEAEELLQQMNTHLLTLEKDPSHAEALNAIFRCAHTIKGMSASMGYTQIAELAHKMEDVLAHVRSTHAGIASDMINLLFKGFDYLQYMISLVEKNTLKQVDISELVTAFDVFLPVSEEKKEIPSGTVHLSHQDKKNIGEAKDKGYNCFFIQVLLQKDCIFKGVRAFVVLKALEQWGNVIQSFPAVKALEEDRIDHILECVWISREQPERIRKKILEILDIAEVTIKQMDVPSSWNTEPIASPIPPPLEVREENPFLFEEGAKKIQTVRIDIKKLDSLMNLVEGLSIDKLRLTQQSKKLQNMDLDIIIENISRLVDQLQAEIMQARLVPVGHIFERFPRMVRDIAQKEKKQIQLEIVGSDIELDRSVLDEIADPVMHLLRNAVDHGIEPPELRKSKGKKEEGVITLSAYREKSDVYIEVKDNGQGMDLEVIKKVALQKEFISKEDMQNMTDEQILFLTTYPGFSTSEEVTEISGRGVGLDVARAKIETLGGKLAIHSVWAEGTKISLRLPLTTAVIKALIVEMKGRSFAIPIASVVEIVTLDSAQMKTIEGKETFMHRNAVLPLVRLEWILTSASGSYDTGLGISNIEHSKPLKIVQKSLPVVIVEFGTSTFGIVVERLVGQYDIVIKQLGRELRGVKGVSGATILGDGAVALVLDVGTLL